MRTSQQQFHRRLASQLGSFSKANATALASSLIDLATLYCLVEFAHVYYVVATASAAAAGAVTNFTLNRFWAFRGCRGRMRVQGAKYALVSGASLLLNTSLVFCFTEFGRIRYLISKIVASLAIGWGWNYPLHRFFVFPAQRSEKSTNVELSAAAATTPSTGSSC